MRHLTDPVVLGLLMCYLFLIILLYHAANEMKGKTWGDQWRALKGFFTKAR